MRIIPAQLRRGTGLVLTAHFIFIALVTLFLHYGALGLWWCCDDTQILKHATNFTPLQYFAVPGAWQALNNASLTPWLSFVYDIDLALFGYEPLGFYAHNLLTIMGCAWLIYLLVRHWVSPSWGLVAAFLFLVGVPSTVAAQQLMTRHYVEGLFFYLLALWLFLRAFSSHRLLFGLLAGAAFAVAASAKEVYLPLGFLVLILPVGSWRQRLLAALPIWGAMLLYVPWRWYMLGDAVGGYTPVKAFSFNDLVMALGALSSVPKLLWASPREALLACGGLLLLFAWCLRSHFFGMAWRLFLVLVLLAVPLVPLVKSAGLIEARFYIAAWAVFAVLISLLAGLVAESAAKAGNRWIALAPLGLLMLVAWPAWQASRLALTANTVMHASYRAQGEVLVGATDAPVLFASPEISPWFLSGLVELRPAMGEDGPPARIIYDESQLMDDPPGERRVLRYSPETRGMRDMGPHLQDVLQPWHARLRKTELSVRFEFDPQLQALVWQGSGVGVGKMMTAIVPGSAYPVPLQGSFRVAVNPFSAMGCIRFRFEMADAGISYSPALQLPEQPAGDGVYRLVWSGPSDMFAGPQSPLCRRASGA